MRPLVLSLVWLANICTAQVLNNTTQPNNLGIEITSIEAHFDAALGVAHHSGNVVLKQGDKILTAEHMRVYRIKNQIVKVEAQGTPAVYTQKGILGKAQTLEYLPTVAQLSLAGSARIERGKDTVSGAYIVYDIQNKSVKSISDKTDRTLFTIGERT